MGAGASAAEADRLTSEALNFVNAPSSSMDSEDRAFLTSAICKYAQLRKVGVPLEACLSHVERAACATPSEMEAFRRWCSSNTSLSADDLGRLLPEGYSDRRSPANSSATLSDDVYDGAAEIMAQMERLRAEGLSLSEIRAAVQDWVERDGAEIAEARDEYVVSKRLGQWRREERYPRASDDVAQLRGLAYAEQARDSRHV